MTEVVGLRRRFLERPKGLDRAANGRCVSLVMLSVGARDAKLISVGQASSGKSKIVPKRSLFFMVGTVDGGADVEPVTSESMAIGSA